MKKNNHQPPGLTLPPPPLALWLVVAAGLVVGTAKHFSEFIEDNARNNEMAYQRALEKSERDSHQQEDLKRGIKVEPKEKGPADITLPDGRQVNAYYYNPSSIKIIYGNDANVNIFQSTKAGDASIIFDGNGSFPSAVQAAKDAVIILRARSILDLDLFDFPSRDQLYRQAASFAAKIEQRLQNPPSVKLSGIPYDLQDGQKVFVEVFGFDQVCPVGIVLKYPNGGAFDAIDLSSDPQYPQDKKGWYIYGSGNFPSSETAIKQVAEILTDRAFVKKLSEMVAEPGHPSPDGEAARLNLELFAARMKSKQSCAAGPKSGP